MAVPLTFTSPPAPPRHMRMRDPGRCTYPGQGVQARAMQAGMVDRGRRVVSLSVGPHLVSVCRSSWPRRSRCWRSWRPALPGTSPVSLPPWRPLVESSTEWSSSWYEPWFNPCASHQSSETSRVQYSTVQYTSGDIARLNASLEATRGEVHRVEQQLVRTLAFPVLPIRAKTSNSRRDRIEQQLVRTVAPLPHLLLVWARIRMPLSPRLRV